MIQKKLSILIYSLASGGAERQVSILLKELSKKYKIYLILMNDTIFYDIPHDVKVVYLEKSSPIEGGVKKFAKLPILAFKYKKILIHYNIDISLSFLNRPNYINILATKGIVSERTNPLELYKINSLKNIINLFFVKTLYKKASKVICNSKGTEFDLNKVGIYNTKVVFNMLNVAQILSSNKETLNTKKDRFIFITVGRLEYQKNTTLLIEAMKEINAILWIIGDGYLMENLKFKINNEGLNDKVQLLGRQKNVYKFMNEADAFVFSSNHEGFPNVLLEALACGLPIISTDCKSGPREILAPNTDFRKQTEDIELAEYGVLTPVGDVKKIAEAMKVMLNDNNLRERYSQKALNRAKAFSVEKIIKEWEGIV